MEEDEEFSIKVFPKPSKEDLEKYVDKKKRIGLITVFAVSTTVLAAIFVLSLIAIITVSNYSLFNIMILLVLITLIVISASKLALLAQERIESRKSIVTNVKDITETYEKISGVEKGKKVKLQIFLDVGAEKEKKDFAVLFDKVKKEELEPEIPDQGNEIWAIYDTSKQKIIDIHIPELKPYIELF